MKPFATAENQNAIDNHCTNLALSKKIENRSRFNENANWHETNKRKQETHSNSSKHDIH